MLIRFLRAYEKYTELFSIILLVRFSSAPNLNIYHNVPSSTTALAQLLYEIQYINIAYMSAIIGTGAPISSDLNLLLQIVVLTALIFGTMSGIKKRFIEHSRIMTAVVILNAAGLVFVMAPSLFIYLASHPEIFSFSMISTSLHVVTGISALATGMAFILNKKPLNVRLWMRLSFLLWVTSFILGFLIYLQIAGLV